MSSNQEQYGQHYQAGPNQYGQYPHDDPRYREQAQNHISQQRQSGPNGQHQESHGYPTDNQNGGIHHRHAQYPGAESEQDQHYRGGSYPQNMQQSQMDYQQHQLAQQKQATGHATGVAPHQQHQQMHYGQPQPDQLQAQRVNQPSTALPSFAQFQQNRLQQHHQQNMVTQQQAQAAASQIKDISAQILDKNKLKEMCREMCGNRDLLDDKVVSILSMMVDQMVENVVDQSCMYARHRESDTLEKEDVAFALSQLFPEISRDGKVQDVQLLIDQQVNLNHAMANPSGQPEFSNFALGTYGGTSIGVGGQVSTSNYKNKLLRVRKEQEQQMTMNNVKETLKQQADNIGQTYMRSAKN